MKFIITDNIRVANVHDRGTGPRSLAYLVGRLLRIKFGPGKVKECNVIATAWAGQSTLVIIVDELGTYARLEKQVLAAAATKSPTQIKDVMIYWSVRG